MSATSPSISNQALDRMIERIDEIAVLPHVVYKVLELSATTDTAATEIERAIVIDPGFSTRLLALANSAFYALPRRVTSIRDAVAFLGYKQIRQLAMTVGFFDMFVGKNDKESLRRRAWWRHSIDSAICCRWLAQETKKLPPEDAYTCGLLHYIGKPLLDRHQAGGYEQVDQLIAVHQYSELEAEATVFGCHHVEVAIGACTKWRMPERLLHALNYQTVVTNDVEDAYAIATVALGSSISRMAVDGPASGELPMWALRMLGFDTFVTEDLIERAIDVVASSRKMQL